jgi:hypothetical protein
MAAGMPDRLSKAEKARRIVVALGLPSHWFHTIRKLLLPLPERREKRSQDWN